MSDESGDDQTAKPEEPAAAEQTSTEEAPTSHRNWFVAVATVTALAVGLAGIGLAATSKEQTAESAAVGNATPGDVAGITLQTLITEHMEFAVIGDVVGAAAGFGVTLGLDSGLAALGFKSDAQRTNEELAAINNRLDQVSKQLTEINSHLDVMSQQMATVGTDVEQLKWDTRSTQVDTAIGEIKNIYGTYLALLCAKGVEAEKQLGIDSSGKLYDEANCSKGVANYETEFLQKYSNPAADRYQVLHDQLMPPIQSNPSILTDFVRVYAANRKYWTHQDSVQLRDYYTYVSEYAALDAYLHAEFYVLDGRQGEATNVVQDWYNNSRAEQTIIPPMLPQGVVISLPNGVGPAATNPSLMFTPPAWMGTQAPSNFPNSQSVSTIQDLPLDGVVRPQDPGVQQRPVRWSPDIGPHKSCANFNNAGPTECSTLKNVVNSYRYFHDSFAQNQWIVSLPVEAGAQVIPVVDGKLPVGDDCERSAGGAIQGCIPGDASYVRAMDSVWSPWGSAEGWRLPTVDEAKTLAAAAPYPTLVAAATGIDDCGNWKQADQTPVSPPSWTERQVELAKGWCTQTSRFWTGDTSRIETETVRTDVFPSLVLPRVDQRYQCSGAWNRHVYVDLSDGSSGSVGPVGNVSPSWADRTGSPGTGTEDAKCAYAGMIPAPAAGQLPTNDTTVTDPVAFPMSVRPVTTAKGDDYLAQNAMTEPWPVIQPTRPSKIEGVYEPGCGCVLVNFNVPASDGGAPITSYKVTATPTDVFGSIDCPITYTPQPQYDFFEAECQNLTIGQQYTFKVVATNSQMLSGGGEITGSPAPVPTATTVAPTTAPATATSSTTPSATTTTPSATTPNTTAPVSASANRDASKNIEAESYDRQCSNCSGVTIKPNDTFTSGGYIAAISTGDWVAFDGVSTPAGSDANFAVRVASGASTTGTIQLHADAPDGPLLASVPVSQTGGWHTWTTLTAPKQSTLGTRNIYLVFSSGQSGDFVNVDWFKFTG